jgi:hypothetical protein
MTRLEALCKALGWQGGTIHQVAAATGCKVKDLLTSTPSSTALASDHSHGWSASRTCDLEWNRRVNFPRRMGNLDFWLGVADGLMVQAKEGAIVIKTLRKEAPG